MSRKSASTEDPLTYRIAYSRIVQQLHARSQDEYPPIPAARVREAIAAMQREVPGPQRPTVADEEPRHGGEARAGAVEQVRDLVDESREELLRLGHRWVGQRPSRFERLKSRRRSAADSRLAAFLACVVEPATVAVYFSMLVEEGWLADFAPRLPETEPVDRRLGPRSPEAFHGWLRSYLDHIRQPNAEISYRARYNLACLFSRSAWQYQREEVVPDFYLAEATRQLELCLAEVSGRRRAAIQSWAWRDPAFAGLKELRWEAFSSVLGTNPEAH
jgi:hypothetical protein